MTVSASHRLEEVYSMSVQLALCFDEVPITCEIQQRYHSISPCLAGKRSAEEQADALGISYSAVCRWLRQFREEGMPGLFRIIEPTLQWAIDATSRRSVSLINSAGGVRSRQARYSGCRSARCVTKEETIQIDLEPGLLDMTVSEGNRLPSSYAASRRRHILRCAVQTVANFVATPSSK
jgi:hypothetical protein